MPSNGPRRPATLWIWPRYDENGRTGVRGGEGARRRAWRAPAPTTKDAALEAAARLLASGGRRSSRRTPPTSPTSGPAALTAALRDRLDADRGADRGDGRGSAGDRALPDPVGEELEHRTLESGLDLRKVRVPLGVIAVIYEARPNVTIDCAALTFKSGNAIVLRGSSYAARSNGALAAIVRERCAEAGLPEGAVRCCPAGGRDDLAELATQDGRRRSRDPARRRGPEGGAQGRRDRPGDVRGGGQLPRLRPLRRRSRKARRIAVNAKVDRPGVCNSAETLLVHADVAAEFLPAALAELRADGVELVGDERARAAAGRRRDSGRRPRRTGTRSSST